MGKHKAELADLNCPLFLCYTQTLYMINIFKGGNIYKMESQPVIAIRLTQCKPELEEKFNRWYNEVHIPLFLKSKWLDRVTRYQLVPGNEDAPKYLAIYEFKDQQAYADYISSPEFAAALKDKNETWREESYELTVSAAYKPVRTWQKSA